MPAMNIIKSVEIAAAPDSIHSILSDFTSWPTWSPWFILEPGCKVEYSDDGKSYTWEGTYVGSGHMEEVSTNAGRIDYALTFLKPWKSTAKVHFLLEEIPTGTRVSWGMTSKLPWFLFWMKKMMEVFVGMDYERGLRMLKDYAETGSIPSALEFSGQETFPGCQYIGIKNQTTLQGISELMPKDCQKLAEYLASCDGCEVQGEMFCLYAKFDPVKDIVQYIVGLPVDSEPEDLDDSFISREIPETQVYKIKHTGPYQYLGNAWAALYAMERGKSIKSSKQYFPFERYLNMPGEVEDTELQTEILFPIKS